MKTKAEVYQADDKDGSGYWVCPCIQVGGYYKHYEKIKSTVKTRGQLAIQFGIF